MTLVKKLESRVYELLTSSLKPVRFTLSISAFIIAAVVLREHFTVAPTSDLIIAASYINAYVIAAVMSIYAALSLVCCLATTKSLLSIQLHYCTSTLGIVVWSFILVATLSRSFAGTDILHIMPIGAEAWALVQLFSKIREVDRRKL